MGKKLKARLKIARKAQREKPEAEAAAKVDVDTEVSAVAPTKLPESVKVEMALHAKRMARIERLRELAEEEKKAKEKEALLARIEAVTEKETLRHDAKIQAIVQTDVKFELSAGVTAEGKVE